MIRVLIIDDDKLARKGLISIVGWEELGMEVIGECSNGAKAMEFLEHTPADLAVVDLSMPVMNGLEFIRASRMRWPLLQYVVLSFHEDFENVQSALRLGTLDYISKIRLEHNDCTKVFRRVAGLMRASREEADSGVYDTETWRDLQKRWVACHWLYSHQEWEQLAMLTKEAAPPLRELEHFLVKLREVVREDYQAENLPPVPGLAELDTGLHWLSELRQLLFCSGGLSGGGNSVHCCILAATIYMREHVGEDMTIHDLARQVNLSRSYFATNFKRIVGQTFNHFLRTEKVRLAKQLLVQPNANIGDVAQAVGYEDEKYFSKIFSEITGCTPYEYAVQRTSSAPREKRC